MRRRSNFETLITHKSSELKKLKKLDLNSNEICSGISWEEKIINERIINKVRHDHGFSKLLSKFIIEKNSQKLKLIQLKIS